MANKLIRGLEVGANVAIICVAVLFGVVLVRSYLLPNSGTRAVPTPPEITIGNKLSLDGVDWVQNKQTLLMVLSEGCHFCTESADFYKRLAAAKASNQNIRLVAVLPQEVGQAQAYMNRLGVEVDEIRHALPSSVGVRGTPTLLLIDDAGTVQQSWIGKLPPDQEAEVLSEVSPEHAGM